jgi:hypothetical protein
MQLWAGALEVCLLWLAAVHSSGRGPTLQEAAQLLVYSLLLYFVPLAAVLWQQHKGSDIAPSSSAAQATQRSDKGDLASGSKAASSFFESACCPCGAISTAAEPSQEDGSTQNQGQSQHLQIPAQQPAAVRAGQQPRQAPLMISVADLASAAQSPGSTLYTSAVRHTSMSTKVSHCALT